MWINVVGGVLFFLFSSLGKQWKKGAASWIIEKKKFLKAEIVPGSVTTEHETQQGCLIGGEQQKQSQRVPILFFLLKITVLDALCSEHV